MTESSIGLVIALRARGFTIAMDLGKPTISPASKLLPKDRAALTAAKPGIIALLEDEQWFAQPIPRSIGFADDAVMAAYRADLWSGGRGYIG